MVIKKCPLRTALGAVMIVLFMLIQSEVLAEEQPIPLEAEDLLKLLQNEGVISAEQAEKVRNISRQRITSDSQTSVEYTSEDSKDIPPATEPGVTRVPYIPEYLKEDIREEVIRELQDEVAEDVIARAREEGWNVQGVDQDWTRRIRFSGDIRVRYRGDFFADGNSTQYPDFDVINASGGTAYAGEFAFFNTTVDRHLLQLRFRLNMQAQVTEGVEVGARIVTGNRHVPVSTNTTLGQYGDRFEIALNRAYLKFSSDSRKHEFTLGRMSNPWMTTQLIWDKDLGFDGIAYSFDSFRGSFNGDGHRIYPFITVGYFPLQEIKLASDDKRMFGAQTGLSYVSENRNLLKFGLALYYFDNITGIKNTPDSTETDYTAPPFVQKGNTMFDISNSTTDPLEELWALAADYHELHLSALYDIASMHPVHVILTANYVNNIGFDSAEIQARTGATVDEKTTGYDFGINVGYTDALTPGNWNVGLNYRYLERDAVLDAFSESDFHVGGTDGKGYKLAFRYGIVKNTWLQLRLISTNEIDGPPLGVMTVLADVNAQF
jgi:hypothetical protein